MEVRLKVSERDRFAGRRLLQAVAGETGLVALHEKLAQKRACLAVLGGAALRALERLDGPVEGSGLPVDLPRPVIGAGPLVILRGLLDVAARLEAFRGLRVVARESVHLGGLRVISGPQVEIGGRLVLARLREDPGGVRGAPHLLVELARPNHVSRVLEHLRGLAGLSFLKSDFRDHLGRALAVARGLIELGRFHEVAGGHVSLSRFFRLAPLT